MNKKDLLYLIVLLTLTFILAMWWFPRATPDSIYYLELVRIFKGNLPLTAATPPFCYRPLMPFIVSLFSTYLLTSGLTFCSINVLLSLVLVWVTYFLVKTFDVSEFGAFVATGLSSVSIMTVSLASVVLVDMPAMVCIGIALIGIRRKWIPASIVVILIVGVAFKEVVILAAVAWAIITVAEARQPRRTWDWNWRRTWFWNWRQRWKQPAWAIAGLLIAVGVYLGIQWLWTTVGVQVNEASFWRWNHLWNLVNRPEGVVDTFWLGFMLWIPAFSIVSILWLGGVRFSEESKWLQQTGIPFLGLMLVGLFTAYFSLRFIWPLYFSMAPIVGRAATVVWDKISEPLKDIAQGLFTVAALFFGILVIIPLSILTDVARTREDRRWHYQKRKSRQEDEPC